MIKSFTNIQLLFHSYLPSIALVPALIHSVYFSFTRKQYWSLIASFVFGLGILHQLAEVKTWLLTGELPAPNWIFGDIPETLIYVLSIVAYFLFVHYYDRTQELLTGKNILLNEINHRVRNNLQMMDSLLSSQIKKVPDDETTDHLELFQQRIKSFSLIYDILYKKSTVRWVNMDDYLTVLCKELEANFLARSDEKIDLDIIPIELSTDKAVACGLIVNELVTNSIQHSDPGPNPLKVEVTLNKNDQYELMVNDNGDNFSPEKFIDRSGGFTLIRLIAEHDLGGDLDIREDGGMVAEITFDKFQS